MKQPILLIFVLNIATTYCQTVEHLWDVFALNSDTAFACSSTGSFYRTFDGGNTWEIFQEISGMDKALSKVYFVDERHGWMTSSYGGYIFRTNDCGSSWDVNSYSIDKVYDLVFQDSLRGWACGSVVVTSGLATYEVGRMLKTEDGGDTWTEKHVGGNFVRSICFSSEDIAWLGSRYDDHWGLMEKSNDGGETWDVQEIPQVLSIEKIFFFNDKIGWAVGHKRTTSNGVSYWVTQLLQTLNGGETWEIQTEDFEYPINDIHFLNDSSGIAIHRFYLEVSPNPSHILITSDGGDNWEINSSYTDRLGGMHFVDEQTGWIVGENELILKTTDGGMNWERQDNFSVIDVINKHELPDNLDLLQNYPNPFNASTTIQYSISKPSLVNLKIYDLIGNELETLVDQHQRSGIHRLTFYGDRVASGLYFYTLIIDDRYSTTKKMLLIR